MQGAGGDLGLHKSGVCPGKQRQRCESAPLSPCTKDRADKTCALLVSLSHESAPAKPVWLRHPAPARPFAFFLWHKVRVRRRMVFFARKTNPVIPAQAGMTKWE
jgi:hypothetical protein